MKRMSKSDAPSKVGKPVFKKGAPQSGAIFQQVCQKVEYFSQKCWKLTAEKCMFLLAFYNKMHENGLWPQNAYCLL